MRLLSFLIRILCCLNLAAEEFFQLLLCYFSKVKANEGLRSWVALDAQDKSRFVPLHKRWLYYKIWPSRWITGHGHSYWSQSKCKLEPHTCLLLEEGLQKCWTSWSLLSFPLLQSCFANVIASEQLCVITNSRQQYLCWQDLDMNLRAISFHKGPTNYKCILWKQSWAPISTAKRWIVYVLAGGEKKKRDKTAVQRRTASWLY